MSVNRPPIYLPVYMYRETQIPRVCQFGNAVQRRIATTPTDYCRTSSTLARQRTLTAIPGRSQP